MHRTLGPVQLDLVQMWHAIRSLDQAAFKAILISLEVFHLLTAFFFLKWTSKKRSVFCFEVEPLICSLV
jgi:hypothetical protein